MYLLHHSNSPCYTIATHVCSSSTASDSIGACIPRPNIRTPHHPFNCNDVCIHTQVRVVPMGVDPHTDWTAAYPLAQAQPTAAPTLTVTSSESGWTVSQSGADGLVAVVSSSSPTYNITRIDGTLLSAQLAPPTRVNSSKCGAALGGPITGGMWPDCPDCCLRATRSLLPGEQVFGGGVQLYAGPSLRGTTLFLRTNAVVGTHAGWSHVVAPFFLSSMG